MAAGPTGTVTFLFTDIEASTELWERHPDEMRVAVEVHDQLLRTVVAAHGGGSFLPEATGSPWPWLPLGMRARRRLRRSAVWTSWTGRSTRTSVCGWASIRARRSSSGGDYFGPAVNRAARLAAASNAGQIVMSLATEQMVREHLPGDHSLADLGELRVAGVVAPLPVFGSSPAGSSESSRRCDRRGRPRATCRTASNRLLGVTARSPASSNDCAVIGW